MNTKEELMAQWGKPLQLRLKELVDADRVLATRLQITQALCGTAVLLSLLALVLSRR